MKKKTKVVLSIVGVIVLLILAAFIFVCQSFMLLSGKVNNDEAYKTVLSDIEKITVANPRVVDIAMLGAHDANTANLSSAKNVGNEVTSKGLKFVYKIAPGLSYRYTKTQVSSVSKQLCQGVRFLHIKCSYFNDSWYGSHSLIDDKIEVYIKDVINFLHSNRGEIVVLEMQIMYGADNTLGTFIDDLFNINYEGETLADYIRYDSVPLGDLRYNTVTDNGQSSGAVILLAQDHNIRKDFWNNSTSEMSGKCYFSNGIMYNPWTNRMSTKEIVKKLDNSLEYLNSNTNYENSFRVMQITTSPSPKDLFTTINAWSLIRYAKKHNIRILENPNFDNWQKAMPIILCDFTTSYGFNAKINDRIMQYNIELVSNLIANQD